MIYTYSGQLLSVIGGTELVLAKLPENLPFPATKDNDPESGWDPEHRDMLKKAETDSFMKAKDSEIQLCGVITRKGYPSCSRFKASFGEGRLTLTGIHPNLSAPSTKHRYPLGWKQEEVKSWYSAETAVLIATYLQKGHSDNGELNTERLANSIPTFICGKSPIKSLKEYLFESGLNWNATLLPVTVSEPLQRTEQPINEVGREQPINDVVQKGVDARDQLRLDTSSV